MRPKADEWYECVPWPWQKITYLDGTRERCVIVAMRNRAGQYRQLTPDELWEWRKYDAW